MGVRTGLTRAVAMARLELTRRIELGGRMFRTTGVFPNELALQGLSGGFEPWLEPVYQALLRCKEGTFVDVGANVGQTMLRILAIDSARPYVGFEPQPLGCWLIQSFIEENSLRGHTILPLGLSDRNHLVTLHTKSGGPRCAGYESMSTTVENFRPDSFYTSSQDICVRKGDEVMTELGISSICAIKIDVEGGELEVIEGLSETTREKAPPIIFEVLNHDIALAGERLDEQTIRFRQGRVEQMESHLRGQGDQIYNMLPGNILKRVRKIQPRMSKDLSDTNYIAVSPHDDASLLGAFPWVVQDA
jgi:FkbM family methyltransferase